MKINSQSLAVRLKLKYVSGPYIDIFSYWSSVIHNSERHTNSYTYTHRYIILRMYVSKNMYAVMYSVLFYSTDL